MGDLTFRGRLDIKLKGKRLFLTFPVRKSRINQKANSVNLCSAGGNLNSISIPFPSLFSFPVSPLRKPHSTFMCQVRKGVFVATVQKEKGSKAPTRKMQYTFSSSCQNRGQEEIWHGVLWSLGYALLFYTFAICSIRYTHARSCNAK